MYLHDLTKQVTPDNLSLVPLFGSWKRPGLGDDYWKVVGALGEKARYGAALRKGGVDIDNVSPAVKMR